MTTTIEHTTTDSPDLTPVSVEYTQDNKVEATLTTEAGLTRLTMSATALLDFIGLGTKAINERTAQFIRAATSPPLAGK